MRTPRRIRAEVDEEIRVHLEMRAAELERAGLDPDEAWEEALRRFGDLETTRSVCYETDLRRERRMNRRQWLGELAQDVRQAVRQLRRRPVFTTAAVVTLAVGIGASTAIFSAADHVVLRPLPYADADRVVTLWETDRETGERHKEVSPGNFIAWEERADGFEAMGLAEPYSVDLTGGDGPPESIATWSVTDGFLAALGVRPILGPGFGPQHYEPGGPRAAMVSHGLWRQRFGGDPSVVGGTIELDGAPVTVAGVLPPWLEYPEPKRIWTPKRYRPNEAGDRVSSYMHAVARLRPGTTVERAQAELDAVAASLAADFPRTNADAGIRAIPLEDEIVGGMRPALMVLLGAVAFLLLIACANVAHLLLARAAERRHELSVRASLGAGRTRLARQLMTESLVLALLGGLAGVGLAAGGIEAIVALSPPELPRIDAVSLDGRVLAFAAAVTLATAVLFGLAPALRLSRSNALAALRGGRRSRTADRHGARARDGLVVAEIAFAMILLVGAALLARSFATLLSNDLGFAPEHRVSVQAFLWDRNPTAEQRRQRVAEIDARFEALPGVECAAVVTSLPFHPTRITTRGALEVVGRPVAEGARREVDMIVASPDYFRTMGIPLVRGRVFEPDPDPDADGPARVVVNETLVRRFFDGEDPIGARVSLPSADGPATTLEVVGVVGDVRPATFASEPEPELYHPYSRSPGGSVTFVVHTSGDAGAMMPSLRDAFWQIDPGQSIYHEATVEQLVSDTLVERRFLLLLIGVFSAVALVLAAVGVYGVISFATSRRVNEIGIRIALGAKPRDVAVAIVRRGIRLGVPGVLLGGLAALGLTRFLESMLYGVRPTDPFTFVQTGAALLTIAALAAYLPARRAAGVDPAAALREE